MSCNVVVSLSPQKPNTSICTSKCAETSTWPSFGNGIMASSPLPFSGRQFQLAWKKKKIRPPFSRKYKERFEVYALSSCLEGENWISVDAENDNNLEDGNGFIVVNFYHFVFIEEPEEEASKHLSLVQIHVCRLLQLLVSYLIFLVSLPFLLCSVFGSCMKIFYR